jgi:adenosine deaminase
MNQVTSLCELHVHLEGCLWPGHFQEFWNRSEFLFPPPRFTHGREFDNFLAHLRFGYAFLNSPDAYASVARDYAVRAVKSGIRYAEVQINIVVLRTWHLELTEVLGAINAEMAALPRAPTLRYILDLPWQFLPQLLEDFLSDSARLFELGVRGVSMGGDETSAIPSEVGPVFEKMRASGFGTICHAGETGDPGLAREIVEELKPSRIGHAVLIADWIKDLGPKAPGIDVCLSSNVALGVIKRFEDHPLEAWLKAGVRTTLSTDDPAIFSTNLQQEYSIAERTFGNLNLDQTVLNDLWVQLSLDPEAARVALGL